MLPFGDIPAELYRWFLIVYGTTAAGRVAVESYKQMAIIGTAWYDVPTLALMILEQGFLQHGLLSLAGAEMTNMVLGALMKRKARTEGREQGRAEGKAEGKAEGRAEGKAEGRAEGRAEGKAEGHAEGKAAGTAEANMAWREWLRRKEQAEAAGQTFGEPAPDSYN